MAYTDNEMIQRASALAQERLRIAGADVAKLQGGLADMEASLALGELKRLGHAPDAEERYDPSRHATTHAINAVAMWVRAAVTGSGNPSDEPSVRNAIRSWLREAAVDWNREDEQREDDDG